MPRSRPWPRSVVDDPAILELDDAAGDVADEPLVVGRGDEADAMLEMLTQELEQTRVPMPVLPERRLIEDEHARAADQDAGERQPSLLAARQPVRTPIAKPVERQLESLHELRHARGLRRREPEADLVLDAFGQELALGILEDVPGASGQVGGLEPRGIRAAEIDPASIRSQQPDEQAPERRLAAAVRADKGDPLPSLADNEMSRRTGTPRSYANRTSVARTTSEPGGPPAARGAGHWRATSQTG